MSPFRVTTRATLLLLLLASSVSRAAPPEVPSQASMESAHAAFIEAEAAYKLGHFDEAAAKYEAVYRLIHFPQFLFNTAQAQRRWYDLDKNLEHLRRALDLYQAFLRDAPSTAVERATVLDRIVPDLLSRLAAETQRQRAELIAQATGEQGVFLADQLLAEGAPADAALALDHVLAAHGSSREALLGALEKRVQLVDGDSDKTFGVELCKRALAIDPGYLVPDGTTPEALVACAEARSWMAGKKPLALSHVAPGEVKHGEPARIGVTVDADPLDQVRSIAVLFRRAGGGAFSTARAPKEARSVDVPAPFLDGLRGGTSVEYFVSALDENDNQLATVGSAKQPFVFVVALTPEEIRQMAARDPAQDRPLVKRPWFWGLLGAAAVVVAAGITLGVVLGNSLGGPSATDGAINYLPTASQ